MKSDELVSYYSARASEYDSLYERPERQEDLKSLRDLITPIVAGRRVLEIACGTGQWTKVASDVARSVTATDVGPEMLEIARRRNNGARNVQFEFMDAYNLGDLRGRYDVLMAGFWWSHVSRAQIGSFLASVSQSLGPGVHAVYFDNRYVEGSNTPIHRLDDRGNTYQLRSLAEGSKREVLKNFPDESELRLAVGESGTEPEFQVLKYYWFATYTTR